MDNYANFLNNPRIKKLHFAGAGGISMSSLAAISAGRGYFVTGSDRTETALTRKLEAAGVGMTYCQNADNITADMTADNSAVIYTAAIAQDNPELVRAREKGITIMTRAEFLGALMLGSEIRIGVAGTHGKSTTTAMLSDIMLSAGLDPEVVVGAEMNELGAAYRVGRGPFVFEACEYTDSFLSFFPTTAVVTNIELDHADYFHSLGQYVESFRRYIALADTAVVNPSLPNVAGALAGFSGRTVGFGIAPDPGVTDEYYRAENITYEGGFARFDITHNGAALCRTSLSVPGEHNIYDALAAAAAALVNGAGADSIKAGLERFRGARRRFEYRGTLNGARCFDDYAHHPTEIKATLAAAKKLGGRIICVFQPHSVSRTAELFGDFVSVLGDSMPACDGGLLILADIYENLEHDTGKGGVTSALLADKIPGAEYIPEFEKIAARLRNTAEAGDNIIIMGAGDIYKLFGLIGL